jgi:hypothetical protein
MLTRLFPRSLTNAYQGSWAALWLLAPVLLMKTVIGFNFSGLNPFISVSEVLQTVDGVPLDTFSPEAAATIVDSAGAWGMALFALCLFCWLVIARYRAGLPAAILVLLIEQVGRTGVGTVRVVAEIVATSEMLAAGAWINLAMTALLTIALLLSLVRVRPLN